MTVNEPTGSKHVATWPSFGEVLLTLGRSSPERASYPEVLDAEDAHPHVHFVQPTLPTALGDFGVRLDDLEQVAAPVILDREPWMDAFRADSQRELLQRIHAVPAEERLWCLEVLEAIYKSIQDRVRALLPSEVVWVPPRHLKTLPATSVEVLHISRFEACEPHRPVQDECEGKNSASPDSTRFKSSDDQLSDKRVKFNIVVHIHADSELAKYLDADTMPQRGPSRDGEPASAFEPPDWRIERCPSSWGFETYSTRAWDDILKQWSGRIEERILKQSVMLACEAAMTRIRSVRKRLKQTVKEKAKRERATREDKRCPDPGGKATDEAGTSSKQAPASTDAKPGEVSSNAAGVKHDDASSTETLARTNRLECPTSFYQQLDYTPSSGLVRGPRGPPSRRQPRVVRERIKSASEDPASDADVALELARALDVTMDPLDGKFASPHTGSAPASECSTPRASTPVATPAPTIEGDESRTECESTPKADESPAASG